MIKKIQILFIFLSSVIMAELPISNTANAQYIDSGVATNTESNMVTNQFYKLRLTNTVLTNSITAGSNSIFFLKLINCGSINETGNIGFSYSIHPSMNVSFYQDNPPFDLFDASDTLINSMGPILAGATNSFIAIVSIPYDTMAHSTTLYLTNTGQLYPFKVNGQYTTLITPFSGYDVHIVRAFDGITNIYETQLDGSGMLFDLSTTIYVQITNYHYDHPPILYYSSQLNNGTPLLSSPEEANYTAFSNGYFVYTIPASSPFVVPDNTIYMTISLMSIEYTNTLTGGPWAYIVKELPNEEDGITIFDNMIHLSLNEVGSLGYRVDEDGAVNISVFNVRGRKLATLLDTYKIQGSYILKWNGKNNSNRNMAPGLYFIAIHTPTSRKLVKFTIYP